MVEPYKAKYAKNPVEMSWLQDSSENSLLEAVKHAGVTVLIGTSGQAGCFTREVVEAMAVNCERPVILPLSNPTDKTEALPKDIYQWTSGKALVATGSPFPPVAQNGRKIRIGQCNNVFISPALGLEPWQLAPERCCPRFLPQQQRQLQDWFPRRTWMQVYSCHGWRN
jgi:malate dehydrogenase (oxaloacetate-decarboxylating)